MRIVAHRGGSTATPENTLAAFANALALGADLIELDVHLSSDGVPVVIHDHTLERTTNGTGAVASYSVAELQRFDAGDGEQIPTLAEVFALVGDAVPITIEVKAIATVDATIDVIRAWPSVRWNGASSSADALRRLRAAFPDADLVLPTLGSRDAARQMIVHAERIGMALDAETIAQLRADAESLEIADVLAHAEALTVGTITCHHSSIDAAMVHQVRSQGLRLSAWTVNDTEEAKRLSSLGVDALLTDDPAAMIALRDGHVLPA